MTSTVPFLKNGPRLNQQLWAFTITGLIFFVLSVLSLIVPSMRILVYFFLPISMMLGIFAFRKYSQSYHALAVFSSSFETTTRTRHDIIPFEDIISIKIQYQEELPGFLAFHPIDIVNSLFSRVKEVERSPYTQLYYEIETDGFLVNNYFIDIDHQTVSFFIERIYETTGMKPHSQTYQTVEYQGTLFYFSFRDLHTELDPDSVRELL